MDREFEGDEEELTIIEDEEPTQDKDTKDKHTDAKIQIFGESNNDCNLLTSQCYRPLLYHTYITDPDMTSEKFIASHNLEYDGETRNLGVVYKELQKQYTFSQFSCSHCCGCTPKRQPQICVIFVSLSISMRFNLDLYDSNKSEFR